MIAIQKILNNYNKLRLRYLLMILYSSTLALCIGLYYLNNYLTVGYKIKTIIWTSSIKQNKLSTSFYDSAKLAYDQGLYELAIDELTQEISKNSLNADAYYLLGLTYENYETKEGKYLAKMVENYEKYIIMHPNGDRAYHAKLKISQYYVSKGLKDQNIDYLNKAEALLQKMNGDDSSVRMALGAIYLEKGNYDEAIKQFERSANLTPGDIAIKYNSLGLAYIKTGAFAKAQNALEIAVELEPTNKYSHNNLGFVYSQKKKYNEAYSQFVKALTIDPEYKNARRNLKYVNSEMTKRKARELQTDIKLRDAERYELTGKKREQVRNINKNY